MPNRSRRMARFDRLPTDIRKVVRESPWDIDVRYVDQCSEVTAYIEKQWSKIVRKAWGAKHPNTKVCLWVRA